MVSVTRGNPSPEGTIESVYMWKRGPCRPSQSCSCMIIHRPYWIIKCANIFFEFRLVIRSQWDLPSCNIFTSLLRNSAEPRVVPVRRAKAFTWGKVVPLASTPLVEAGQLAQKVRPPDVNGWLNFCTWVGGNKLKITPARVTRDHINWT